MTNAKEIVEGYQRALGTGDWTAARHYLSDDLSFIGPFDTFNEADPYLEALKKLHPIIERVEPHRMFAEDDDVCVLYDMVTNSPAGTAFIAEWYRVHNGKIDSIRVVFDPRPFEPLFVE